MRILIVYKASGLSDNPFVRLLAEGIRACGFEVVCSVGEFWNRAEAYDVIHLQWPEELFGWSYPTAKQVAALRERFRTLHEKEIPVVYTRHNARPHKGDTQLAKAYRLTEENADAVVHLGNYSRREFLATYPASRQLHTVIPHHIYEGLYAAIDRDDARRKLGIPADAFVTLAFGAFRHASERKLVWRAFRRLPLAGKFLLAPRLWPYALDGSHHRGLKRLAAKTLYHAAHAVENRLRMRITSAEELIPDADLPAYFSAADVVFIQRTDILNSGNVPQSFAFGRVVAGPDSGDIGEMLAATGNPVFDPADPASVDRALAEAARLAAAGHGDKNLEYAREHLRLPQIAAAYGRIYQRLHDAQRQ